MPDSRIGKAIAVGILTPGKRVMVLLMVTESFVEHTAFGVIAVAFAL